VGRVSAESSPVLASTSLVEDVRAVVADFTVFSDTAEGAETRQLAQQLVQMRHMIDRLEALWFGASVEFAAAGGVESSGMNSLATWMRHACNLAPGEAAARARVAESTASQQSPTRQAMRDAGVSWRHASVISAALRQIPAESRDEAERALLEKAQVLDAGQLRRVADRLIHCFDRQRAEEAAIRRLDRRGLSIAETFDGMVSVSGLLDPVTGSLLMTALNTRMRPAAPANGDGHDDDRGSGAGAAEARDEQRSWAQRRADALGDICSDWLEQCNTHEVAGVRPHLSVLVDHATLAAGGEVIEGRRPIDERPWIEPAQLAWVGPITANEAQLIGCDATVSRVLMAGPSQVLDVGRATRTIPPALRRAVSARDRTCVGPGCERPPEHCDVHHVVFWEHGGETSLENTVLLCRRHHRLVHLKQWRVVIDATGRRRLMPPD
jgi:hypothetical protein